MSNDDALNLPELENTGAPASKPSQRSEEKAAADLEPVFDVPVNIQAVLGRTQMEVSELLRLAPGSLLELDRRVGEAIDIYVNNRLVARGEIVLVDDRLGVTMTEIIKDGEGVN
ncbi:MAG: flagellar motor switch protein FliN [Ponticaulis sp.]|nr:flagellar motor switch protein FliN [Ponticaulis sp.]MDF1680059.1 flagellar motor switch protein FliN [Ponticaulis sp.]